MSDRATLAKALRVLAREIDSPDGVANAVCEEAANVIEAGRLTSEERWAVEQAKAAYEQIDDDVCERIVRGLESLLDRKGGEVE